MKLKVFSLLLALGMATSGCVEKSKAKETCEGPSCAETKQENSEQVPSTDAGTQPQVACHIEWSQTSLQFGNVAPGTTKTLTVNALNVGNGDCDIVGYNLANGQKGFSLKKLPAFPVKLMPGAQHAVEITFTADGASANPLTGRQVTDGFYFSTADSKVHPGVLLSAYFGDSCLVAPKALDFGQVSYGCKPRSFKIELVNTCFNDVAITSATIPDTGTFRINEFSQPLPRTIKPGEIVKVPVSFVPNGCPNCKGTLVFTTEANGYSNTAQVALSGSTSITAAQPVRLMTQQFVIPQKTKALIVLDNSASMVEEHEALLLQAKEMLNAAVAVGADIEFGIVTTDVVAEGGGLLVSNQGNRVAKTESQLKGLISAAGISVHAVEEILATTTNALSPAFLNAGNNALIDGTSNLSILLLTDEDDQSIFSTQTYAALLRNRYAGLNGNLLNVSGAVGQSASATAACYSEDATRIRAFTRELGSISSNICDAASWNFYRSLAGERQRIYLRVPVDISAAPIELEINGAPVPYGDFSYDGNDNFLELNQGSIKPGDVVTVRYVGACY